MNRKQRRAAEKLGRRASPPATGVGAAQPSVQVADLVRRAVRYHRVGQMAEAEDCYRKILSIDQTNFDALHLLGVLAQQVGHSELAASLIGQAIALHDRNPAGRDQRGRNFGAVADGNPMVGDRELAIAQANFSIALMALGDHARALQAVQRSLHLAETENTKLLFVQCVRDLNVIPAEVDVRDSMIRALSEPWGRPIDLARSAANLLKRDGVFGVCVQRSRAALPRHLPPRELFSPDELHEICRDRLLRSALQQAPICNLEIERLLTAIRHVLLEAASDALEQFDTEKLRFFSALAQQCFINEYVFACTEEEDKLVERLRTLLDNALAAGIPIAEPTLVAAAAYLPLASLTSADLLIQRNWSSAVGQIVVQQVQKVRQDFQQRTAIPRLTSIRDAISSAVREQYEDNPYPRWVRASPVGAPTTIEAHLREKFPQGDFRGIVKTEGAAILIAGCGTGQHSIETARRFKDAQVLAIDLSLASLAYAKTKTRDLGLKNINYAQADILQIQSIGRTFDVIEAVGVLHHLADPMAGWRTLLSILHDGGFMRLGLYSKLARADINVARTLIAQRGYGSSASEIRRCRQELAAFLADSSLAKIAAWTDFFAMSTCRDLLFHVQEHQITLRQIESFISENRLQFVGFDLPSAVLQNFRRRFPDDAKMTNLAHWEAFENDNPSTFEGMYQFWIRKWTS